MGCGCLLAPLKWMFTSGLKGFIVLGLLAILLLFGYCKVSDAFSGTQPPQEAVISTPSIQEAPYIVTTSSRYYYVKQVEQKNGVTTMTIYWELYGGKWTKHPGSISLGKEFGTVTVGKR